MKYDKEQTDRARRQLTKALAGMKPDQYGKKTFYTNVTHVSKSGMSRRIKVFAVVNGVERLPQHSVLCMFPHA